MNIIRLQTVLNPMIPHPQVLFRTLLAVSSLFLASHGLALGPPTPLTDPEIGGAWTRSQSASTVWTGQHFLSVWIETRESVSDGDWFLIAGRFSAEGERLDGHGVELAMRPSILWADVVIAAGEPHVVMHEPGTTLIARLEDEFELTPVASLEATMRRADVFAEAGRIAVGWTTDWEGPLHAAIVDVTTGSVTGPVAIADDGYVPSISGDGTRFVMVYNRDYYGEGRVEATFLGFDGTIEEQVVVEEDTHRPRPSVALSGDQFLVAYGQPVRVRSMSFDGDLGAIHSWSDYGTPDGYYVDPAEAEIKCGEGECLLTASTWEVCEFSACLVRSELLMTRVDLDGHSLGEGWKLVPEESFGSYDQQIAVDGNRFFLTWIGDSFAHGRVYGTIISGPEITEPFQLSSGGTSQHDPVGADRGDQSLVVWSESAEDSERSCLRAALIDRHGRTIAEEKISECGTTITSWAVSGDADSWLAVWSEYDDELRSPVTRGRIMQPHDLSGDSFLIGQFRANQLSAAGGTGHVVTWRGNDAVYATRISATGLVLAEPRPVIFGSISQPLLVNFGEGVALFWDGGYCPGEQCGFQYRFLTAEGETFGDPVTIGARGFSFDAVETDDGDVLLVWRESSYEVLAAFVRKDGSIQYLGTIASTDGGGSLHVGRDDEGFVVAAELYDGSQGLGGEAVVLRLDRSGAMVGSPERLPRRVREVVGNGLLIERRYVKSAPFYGAPRLFVRNVDEPAPRRRTMRPR